MKKKGKNKAQFSSAHPLLLFPCILLTSKNLPLPLFFFLTPLRLRRNPPEGNILFDVIRQPDDGHNAQTRGQRFALRLYGAGHLSRGEDTRGGDCGFDAVVAAVAHQVAGVQVD